MIDVIFEERSLAGLIDELKELYREGYKTARFIVYKQDYEPEGAEGEIDYYDAAKLVIE